MSNLRRLLFTLILTVSFFLTAVAESPLDAPPPPPGGGHGGGGNQGAPIDGGIAIILMLGAAYGAWKLYKLRKERHTAAHDR